MVIGCSKDSTRTRTSRRGHHTAFTLVELLAVVVLLGLLISVLTVSFRGQTARAKVEIAKTGIGVIVNALETYAIETGSLPTLEQGLDVLTRAPEERGEPYLKPDKLRDPWGNPYRYIIPGPSSTYQVMSYGADGRAGGSGNDKDITSDDLGSKPHEAGP
ncbi:MAG: type II secretion system major pseudopilin GspG [Phycisphaerales bacterium]|nr:type II secretion system major pseudopilin GspG [Phycisphaerales bacterium]